MNENDQALRKLRGAMGALAYIAKKDMRELVKQAAIFAIQSATKATQPGTSSTVKGMPAKYRFRKKERMPDNLYWYQWTNKFGVIDYFKAKKAINKRHKKYSVKRITQGVKIWGRKIQDWQYAPTTKPRDLNQRIYKIPHAGAAKAGWLGAYRHLGQIANVGDTGGMNNLTRVQAYELAQKFTINIKNLVNYVQKTSPMSAQVGLSAAASRMRNIASHELEKLARRGRQYV